MWWLIWACFICPLCAMRCNFSLPRCTVFPSLWIFGGYFFDKRPINVYSLKFPLRQFFRWFRKWETSSETLFSFSIVACWKSPLFTSLFKAIKLCMFKARAVNCCLDRICRCICFLWHKRVTNTLIFSSIALCRKQAFPLSVSLKIHRQNSQFHFFFVLILQFNHSHLEVKSHCYRYGNKTVTLCASNYFARGINDAQSA